MNDPNSCVKAVVLAAGKGTRLQPLTATRQKGMISIAGKPILYHVLSAVKRLGIRDVLMVVGDFKEQVMDYFGDGRNLDLNIKYVEQKKPRGTGHAVLQVKDKVHDSFILLNGDLIFEHSIMDELGNYRGENTVVAAKVENPSEYGVIRMEGSRLKDIVEKPAPGKEPSNLVNTGIYLLEPEIFDYLEKLKPSPRGEYEFTEALKGLSKKSRVNILKLNGYYSDVGRPWELLEANEYVMGKIDHKIEGELEPGVIIKGDVVVEKGTVITGQTYIRGPVYIGKDCEIGPSAYLRDNVNICDGVRIGRAVEVKNSIIMGGTRSEHLTYIGDSLIGSQCNFGAGTKTANLRFDDREVVMNIKGETMHTGRRKLGVIMGDCCKTGVNSCIMPGVKIGPNSWIGPGVVINRDLQSNTCLILRQSYQVKKLRAIP